MNTRVRRAKREAETSPQPYDREFFDFHRSLSESSARVVLPLFFEWVRPSSLIDVGCGIGAWARVAAELGVADVLGVDGAYVDQTQLEIPASSFVSHDLALPLTLDRRFDVALCLEVAEHLPPGRAEGLVADLGHLSDTVLFSAAIPRQGGTDHKNEQWQSYWAELFARAGYDVFDIVRPRVWDDDRIAFWFRQNIFVAATGEIAARLRDVPEPRILDCVHPGWMDGRMTEEAAREAMSVRTLVWMLPSKTYRAVLRRLPSRSR
jgi:hypothetical protein